MKITPDDPRLTAYALGELDEAGCKAIEAELKNSPECRCAVEEIREAAALLTTELATEELPDLTFAQQRKIENQLRATGRQPWFARWRVLIYGLGAATACLMAAMLLPALSKHKVQKPLAVAQNYSRPKPPLSPDSQARPEVETPALAVTVTPPADPASSMPGAKAGDRPPVVVNGPTVSSPVDYLHVQKNDVTKANTPTPANSVAYEFQAGPLTTSPRVPASPGPVSPGRKTDDLSLVQASARPKEVRLNAQNESLTRVPVSGGRGGSRGQADDGAMLGRRVTPLASVTPSLQPSETTLFYRSRSSAQAPGQNRWHVEEAEGLREAPVADGYFGSERSESSTASYPQLVENAFLSARNAPLSTFSIDVDTASYANMRRFLNEGRMPPRDAVRIEELVNYFKYNYPQPRGEDPFSANIEVAGCPWNSEHRLVRVGLKGREIAQDKRPPSNFVFLIDVSGSMQPAERLPLIKQALRQLVKKMTANDRVAIVVYASAAGVKLPSTSCERKETILEAIDQLGAGGSTAGAAGIQAAYRVAQENFIEGGVNRVLLATDGDFNVGMTDQNQLVNLIQEKAKSGVFLTTLGVGTDNYKDALMQKLADKGNGNYHYLDTLEEAQKVLIDQMNGTLVTIAKDVKIQIEFNPSQVGAYRLIGYEKRMLRQEDFNNDAKDAGEIGAGHTVTALYEIVPPGREVRSGGEVDDLKYQPPAEEKPERYVTTGSRELLTLKLRYKQPDGNTSRLLTFPVTDKGGSYSRASTDFKFAAAVAEFGMLLRDSEYKGTSSFGGVLELAEEAKGADAEGYRAEFLTLVRKARNLGR